VELVKVQVHVEKDYSKSAPSVRSGGRMTEAIKVQVRGQLKEQPDRTLTELGEQPHG